MEGSAWVGTEGIIGVGGGRFRWRGSGYLEPCGNLRS